MENVIKTKKRMRFTAYSYSLDVIPGLMFLFFVVNMLLPYVFFVKKITNFLFNP